MIRLLIRRRGRRVRLRGGRRVPGMELAVYNSM
jgi:hypothetical protein